MACMNYYKTKHWIEVVSLYNQYFAQFLASILGLLGIVKSTPAR